MATMDLEEQITAEIAKIIGRNAKDTDTLIEKVRKRVHKVLEQTRNGVIYTETAEIRVRPEGDLEIMLVDTDYTVTVNAKTGGSTYIVIRARIPPEDAQKIYKHIL